MYDAGLPDGASPSLSRLDDLAAGAAAKMAAENFPVALRLLPRAVRADLAAVYRYARFVDDVGDMGVDDVGDMGVDDVGDMGVDDVGDTGADAKSRLMLLDSIEREVRALPQVVSRLRPVADLVPLVRDRGVQVPDLLDLVEANRVDQRVATYEGFDDLLGYCRLSAAPVGRVVLQLAGAASAANIEDSDAVCAALQVLEHCQDVGEDARAGRVYLPRTDLAAEGVDVAALSGSATPPPVRRVVAIQVVRARALLRSGPPLVGRLSGWARIAVSGYVAGGLATADALERTDHDVLGRDVRPAKLRTARHALTLVGCGLIGRAR